MVLGAARLPLAGWFTLRCFSGRGMPVAARRLGFGLWRDVPVSPNRD
ncbi:hypothetical protein I552_0075 [Mycobacterium xenopi 3993]|nr:hypothetical protein I552_0075 [Mycobacterium xenopi 3993]